MTLPIETVAIEDQYARRALDLVAQRFPLTPPDGLGWLPTATATLPTATYNGQDFYYQVTGGGVWHFKYNSTSAKWDFAGGAALYSEVNTTETTASTTFVDLATVGPTITVPFAGDYEIAMYASLGSSAGGSAGGAAVKIGAAATADDDGFATNSGGVADPGIHMGRQIVRTSIAANTVLKLQYRVINAAGTMLARRRTMLVRPVRVS